jgi:hypothetical protein
MVSLSCQQENHILHSALVYGHRALSDFSAPEASALERPPAGAHFRRDGQGVHPRPELSIPSPYRCHPVEQSNARIRHLRSKPTNSPRHDKLLCMPSRLSIWPDSPFAYSTVNGTVGPNGAPHLPLPLLAGPFPRSCPQIPNFEFNITSSKRRSPCITGSQC